MKLTPARKIDRDSLCLLMESSTDGTPFKIKREVDRLRKAFDKGELFLPENEPEQQKWWRCEARMMLGFYSDWSGWEYRDNWAASLWHNKPYPVPPWNGLPTDCLYVMGEQGIGDEVFFASCLHEATKRCKRVIVETVPRLQSIFERCFGVETVPAVVDEKGMRHRQELPEEVTAWVALADLPRMWRLSLSHFPKDPFLTALDSQVDRFKSYRGMTGLSWRGAQGVVEEIKELEGISLQYDQAWDEDLPQPDLDLRNDIEGLLGLLTNLKKVVTVSTSVAHFASALGVETHVIIANPKTASRAHIFPFKWVCKATPGRTPWYSSARVYKNFNDYRSRG